MRGKEGSTIVTIAIAVFLGLAVLSPICHSADEVEEATGFPPGWSDDIRLSYTTNPDTPVYPRNYSVYPEIAVSGNYVHVVWESCEVTKIGAVTPLITANVTYIRSEDNGQTWSDPIFLSNMTTGEWNDPHSAAHPRIAVNGSNVHVVWDEIMGADDIFRIMYRKSTDNGETWGPIVNITPYDETIWRYNPDIAVWNDRVHIVWDQEVVWPDDEIYYVNSTDNGETWNKAQRITFNETDNDSAARIAVNDTTVHIFWVRLLSEAEMMYRKSLDGGISWEPEMLLSLNDGWGSGATDIAVENSSIHVAMVEDKHKAEGGKRQAYYINSTDNGVSFNPQYGKRLPDTDIYNTSNTESIAVDGDSIHVTFFDTRDGAPYSTELYHKNSTDNGLTWGSDLRLTYTLNTSTCNSDIAVNNGFIHIVFQDNRTGDSSHSSEIFYKRYPDFPPDLDYNITFDQGWNLISLPLEQSDESLDKVLEGINGKWDYIQAYDALDPDHWKTNATFKPDQLNDLKSLNHKMGIWINITEPNVNLTVRGYMPSSTSIPLYAGWNLVGYPSLNASVTIGDALWGTGADRVEVCDTSEPYNIREVGPTYIMKPGEGYWVHMPADAVWVVDW